MFESLPPPSASARLRHAAIPPIAAFAFAHVYYSSIGFFRVVPGWLFRVVDVITAAGAIVGAVMIVRVMATTRIRGVAIGWLVIAMVAVYLSASTFVAIALPWL